MKSRFTEELIIGILKEQGAGRGDAPRLLVIITADTNPDFQPFAYASGLFDPDTGLTRFGARDYDPVVDRWTAGRRRIRFASTGDSATR